MITFAIILIIALVLVITAIVEMDWASLLVIPFILGIAWLVFAGVGYLVTMNTSGGPGEDFGNFTVLSTERSQLRALDLGGNQTRGQFFLGTGYVGESRVYEYIESDGAGWKVQNTPVADVTVYEVGKDETPRVERSRIRGNWWWTWTSVWSTASVYVPEGSVQEPNFSVDISGGDE